jgi:hypothetical protein
MCIIPGIIQLNRAYPRQIVCDRAMHPALAACCRVDVTSDEGSTWETADLAEQHHAPHGQSWAWTKWQIPLEVRVCGCDQIPDADVMQMMQM